MNMFKQYIDYIKDNPNHYWFKRKMYGWGWTPATWQGWAVMLVFLGIVLQISFTLPQEATNTQIVWFFAKLITAVAILISICYKTGEKPKWQWGKKD